MCFGVGRELPSRKDSVLAELRSAQNCGCSFGSYECALRNAVKPANGNLKSVSGRRMLSSLGCSYSSLISYIWLRFTVCAIPGRKEALEGFGSFFVVVPFNPPRIPQPTDSLSSARRSDARQV